MIKNSGGLLKHCSVRMKNFIFGSSGGTYLLTGGHCITFIPEKDFLLDPNKFQPFSEATVQKYTGKDFAKELKPVKLLEKAKTLGGIYKPVKRICCYECEDGKLIWADERFARRYRGCTTQYFQEEADAPPFTRILVYTLYDRVVGIVLPIRVVNEEV